MCIVFSHGCEIRTEKRKGEHKTADIGTKLVTAAVLRKQVKTLKMGWRDGRPPIGVECGALAVTASAGLRMSCNETKKQE